MEHVDDDPVSHRVIEGCCCLSDPGRQRVASRAFALKGETVSGEWRRIQELLAWVLEFARVVGAHRLNGGIHGVLFSCGLPVKINAYESLVKRFIADVKKPRCYPRLSKPTHNS